MRRARQWRAQLGYGHWSLNGAPTKEGREPTETAGSRRGKHMAQIGAWQATLHREVRGLAVLSGLLHLTNYHFVIRSPLLHELVVCSALDNTTIFHQQDQIGASDGREAMRDHERRSPRQ